YIFFFFKIPIYLCKEIQLETTVDYNLSSVQGAVKNKIKKYNNHNLLLITNIPYLEKTYKEFLNIFSGEKVSISFKTKIVYIDIKDCTSTSDPSYNDNSACQLEHKSDNKVDHELDHVLYDGLIIIVNILDDKFVSKISSTYIDSFVKAKKNIFLSLNNVIGKNATKLLKSLNIYVHGNNNYVDDIFHNNISLIKNKSEELKNTFYTNKIIENTPIIKTYSQKNKLNILYKGTAHSVLLKEKYYLEVLKCNKTCLLYNSSHEILNNQKKGLDILLVSSIQLENNLRLVFSSSSVIFSDLFFKINNDNKKIAVDLVHWCLNKSGIIRYNNFKLYKSSDTSEMNSFCVTDWDRNINTYENTNDKYISEVKQKPCFYINDVIYVSIDFYELNYNYWIPYKKKDIQFELIHTNIIYRNFLNRYKNANNPTYYKNFKLPNKHGIYK
uniref:Dolichyl-diphosphooligosaccharide--protein glycosyltransferase 48 kDa subunit n=1 Tax=Piliocolobus tephrosceles TaxID=591936 RepID=A0A8C9LMK5_9PRIM